MKWCSSQASSLFYLAGSLVLIPGSVLLNSAYATGVYCYLAAGVAFLFGGAWEVSLALSPRHAEADGERKRPLLRAVTGALIFMGGLSFEAGALFFLPGSSLTILAIGAAGFLFAASCNLASCVLGLVRLRRRMLLRRRSRAGLAAHASHLCLWVVAAALLAAGAIVNLASVQSSSEVTPPAALLWLVSSVALFCGALLRTALHFLPFCTSVAAASSSSFSSSPSASASNFSSAEYHPLAWSTSLSPNVNSSL